MTETTKNLTAELMKKALTSLDKHLKQPVTLIMGGGGAMVLAHGFHLATADIDAIPAGIELSSLDPYIKEVAHELHIPSDWLNPYFSTFSYTLPKDYESRLISVFEGKNLKVRALGKEEMLIMKCFAGRQKDIPHAKFLIKKNVNLNFVESHIEKLIQEKIPLAEKALDFLDDVHDAV